MPFSSDKARETGKDYPQKLEKTTKLALTSELKALRLKYRQAVDSGRRTSHWRVTLLYFERCEKIWDGSPATEQILTGVETVVLDELSEPCEDLQEQLQLSNSDPFSKEGNTVNATPSEQASSGEPSS